MLQIERKHSIDVYINCIYKFYLVSVCYLRHFAHKKCRIQARINVDIHSAIVCVNIHVHAPNSHTIKVYTDHRQYYYRTNEKQQQPRKIIKQTTEYVDRKCRTKPNKKYSDVSTSVLLAKLKIIEMKSRRHWKTPILLLVAPFCLVFFALFFPLKLLVFFISLLCL